MTQSNGRTSKRPIQRILLDNDSETDEDDPEVCPVCNDKNDPNILETRNRLIGCDWCDKWFHWNCVGINHANKPGKTELWFCRTCSGKKPEGGNWLPDKRDSKSLDVLPLREPSKARSSKAANGNTRGRGRGKTSKELSRRLPVYSGQNKCLPNEQKVVPAGISLPYKQTQVSHLKGHRSNCKREDRTWQQTSTSGSESGGQLKLKLSKRSFVVMAENRQNSSSSDNVSKSNLTIEPCKRQSSITTDPLSCDKTKDTSLAKKGQDETPNWTIGLEEVSLRDELLDSESDHEIEPESAAKKDSNSQDSNLSIVARSAESLLLPAAETLAGGGHAAHIPTAVSLSTSASESVVPGSPSTGMERTSVTQQKTVGVSGKNLSKTSSATNEPAARKSVLQSGLEGGCKDSNPCSSGADLPSVSMELQNIMERERPEEHPTDCPDKINDVMEPVSNLGPERLDLVEDSATSKPKEKKSSDDYIPVKKTAVVRLKPIDQLSKLPDSTVNDGSSGGTSLPSLPDDQHSINSLEIDLDLLLSTPPDASSLDSPAEAMPTAGVDKARSNAEQMEETALNSPRPMPKLIPTDVPGMALIEAGQLTQEGRMSVDSGLGECQSTAGIRSTITLTSFGQQDLEPSSRSSSESSLAASGTNMYLNLDVKPTVYKPVELPTNVVDQYKDRLVTLKEPIVGVPKRTDHVGVVRQFNAVPAPMSLHPASLSSSATSSTLSTSSVSVSTSHLPLAVSSSHLYGGSNPHPAHLSVDSQRVTTTSLTASSVTTSPMVTTAASSTSSSNYLFPLNQHLNGPRVTADFDWQAAGSDAQRFRPTNMVTDEAVQNQHYHQPAGVFHQQQHPTDYHYNNSASEAGLLSSSGRVQVPGLPTCQSMFIPASQVHLSSGLASSGTGPHGGQPGNAAGFDTPAPSSGNPPGDAGKTRGGGSGRGKSRGRKAAQPKSSRGGRSAAKKVPAASQANQESIHSLVSQLQHPLPQPEHCSQPQTLSHQMSVIHRPTTTISKSQANPSSGVAIHFAGGIMATAASNPTSVSAVLHQRSVRAAAPQIVANARPHHSAGLVANTTGGLMPSAAANQQLAPSVVQMSAGGVPHVVSIARPNYSSGMAARPQVVIMPSAAANQQPASSVLLQRPAATGGGVVPRIISTAARPLHPAHISGGIMTAAATNRPPAILLQRAAGGTERIRLYARAAAAPPPARLAREPETSYQSGQYASVLPGGAVLTNPAVAHQGNPPTLEALDAITGSQQYYLAQTNTLAVFGQSRTAVAPPQHGNDSDGRSAMSAVSTNQRNLPMEPQQRLLVNSQPGGGSGVAQTQNQVAGSSHVPQSSRQGETPEVVVIKEEEEEEPEILEEIININDSTSSNSQTDALLQSLQNRGLKITKKSDTSTISPEVRCKLPPHIKITRSGSNSSSSPSKKRQRTSGVGPPDVNKRSKPDQIAAASSEPTERVQLDLTSEQVKKLKELGIL